MTRAERIFCSASWLPVACWIASEVYVSQFEGWGQWAAAPILLLPFFLSIIVAISGLLIIRKHGSDRRSGTYLGACTLLAAVPAIWFVVRAWVV